MIIPVKCFTCGKVLADKWNYFKKKSNEIDKKVDIEQLTIEDLSIKEGHDKDNYFDTNKKEE